MQRKLLFLLCFVALLVAAVFFLPEEFDSDLFWTSLREAHPGWITASIAATFLGYVVRAQRWHTLLAPLKHIGFVGLLSTTIIGFGAIFTLGRPGEVVRPLWISRQEGIPTMGAIASIVVERVFDLLILLLLFFVGSMWIDLPAGTREALGGLGTPWQLVAVVSFGIAGFLIVHRYAAAFARRMPFDSARRLMKTFAQGLEATSSARGFATVTLYSMLLWGVHTLQFWFVLEGLGLSYPLTASIMTLVLTSLGSVIQVPGIGGGFQAGFIVAATAVLGTPAEVAIAASLMVWFIITVPTILATGAYMIWKGISVKDLHVEETELEHPAA